MTTFFPVRLRLAPETQGGLIRLRAGELPLDLIRMKAKGCSVSLGGNKGFTLPGDFRKLDDDITKIELGSCSLRGSCFHFGPKYKRIT